MDLKREILMVNCADMDQPTPDNSWGSTGALSCGKRFENVVGIRLIKHNLVGLTVLVYVPEWAPHCVGSYAYKPEITVRTFRSGVAGNVISERLNLRIPTYLQSNNNYYVLSNASGNTITGDTLRPSDSEYLVAEINNREAPFNFDRVSHAIWITNGINGDQSTGWREVSASDDQRFQFTNTYLQNFYGGNNAGDTDYPTYKQPGWDSSIYANNLGNARIATTNLYTGGVHPTFVYEIIMVDETSHIARMPNADQLAIEYKDKVEQTGRYKTNAAEINKAISAFKSFSK